MSGAMGIFCASDSGWLRRLVIAAAAIVVGCTLPVLAAPPAGVTQSRSDSNTKGVVELEIDSSAGISVRMAEDLAGLIDDGATRRVLPVVGRSARQNLTDLVQLRGTDMAIRQTDMVDTLRLQQSVPNLKSSFTYIARLYNEEFHLLAGPGIRS